jgi:hypothetical protein
MARSQLALRKCLRRLKDPRINRCKRHLLLDVIIMALCAVIAGADTWMDLATFARRRKDWFQRFLELPNGITSHHTFKRVFDRLDPMPLQQSHVQWLHALNETLGIRHIAIDGKTLRHSRARLFGPQTLSPWELTCQEVRGRRGQVIHADLHTIAKRLATSAA